MYQNNETSIFSKITINIQFSINVKVEYNFTSPLERSKVLDVPKYWVQILKNIKIYILYNFFLTNLINIDIQR